MHVFYNLFNVTADYNAAISTSILEVKTQSRLLDISSVRRFLSFDFILFILENVHSQI